MTATTTHALIEAERLRLADLADGWTTEQWDTPSLAEGWRVREVVAHLTMPFAVGMAGMAVGLVRHRGSFDRFVDHWARTATEEATPADHVAALRANAASRFAPPGMGLEAPLTDVVVHGLDVRIPLGLPATDLDPDALVTVLGFLTTRAARHFGVPADAFANRRLEATDVDWAHGTGPTERAPATDLLAHLCRDRPLPPS